ncbi:hypothetical protein SPMU_18390 [Sphingomonas mucosissima]|uniref:EF-hand domain-containing protein n=2 Tax=Sphingomonas mucosissima TaxID=370959 RepID=A0A245ZM80_9SPHN|nr:hypothetical protein SPMU_18390 [Sphingomonas mucosissima]
MLRQLIMATTVAVAAPVFAQSADKATPAPSVATPGASILPQQPAPAASGDPAGAAQTPDQASSIVNAEFASYDKDGNGLLDKAEFAAWMDALKARAPAGGDKPGDAKWNEAAFAKADKDESLSLTRSELADFLGMSVKSSAG